MKKMIWIVLMLSAAVPAVAGDLEKASAASALAGMDVAVIRSVPVPMPRPAAVQRKCWNYRKEMITITFVGAEKLLLAKDGNTCVVMKDKTYPNGHVPAEYQSWFRYYEAARVDESTHYGKDNPCTKVFGVNSAYPNTLIGVFRELRLDSALSLADFSGSAGMLFQGAGDGAGPYKDKYICR